MARRNANLAGLAALGALGYALSKGKAAPVEDRSTMADLRDQEDIDAGRAMRAMQTATGRTLRPSMSDEDISQAMDAGYMGGGMKVNPETGELYSTTAEKPTVTKSVGSSRPMAPKASQASVRKIDNDIAARASRNTRTGATAEELSSYSPSRKTSAVAPAKTGVDAIPTEGYRTVEGGERVSGNETTRNLSNIMNATAGLSVPGYVGKMTQAQYNARAAARRAAGDLTPAEIEAAKQAFREAKTLNPNAWMAGPKGMAENFKKGGAVKAKPAKPAKPAAKGWGKARGARGAKYY